VPRVIETDRTFSIFVSVALLKPKHEVLDSHYLQYVLESPKVARQFGLTHAGSALKHIHLVDLRRTRCPLPPPDEQEDIAAVLRCVLSREQSEQESLHRLTVVKSALSDALLTGDIRVIKEDRQ